MTFSPFSLEKAVAFSQLLLSLLVCDPIWSRKFLFPDPSSAAAALSLSWQMTVALLRNVWYFSLGLTRAARSLFSLFSRHSSSRSQRNKRKKEKKESTRRQAASHGGNKKSRADLIWGGERDRDERDQKEPNNQKRKKENENHVWHTHTRKRKKIALFRWITQYSSTKEATISKGSAGSPRCYGSHQLWWIWKRLVQENGRGNVVCSEYFKEEPLFKKWKASKSLGRFDSKHDTEPREILLCPSQHLNSISACRVLHSLLSTHHAGWLDGYTATPTTATPTTRPWRPIWNIEYKPLINKKQSAATAASTAAERESQCLKGVALGIPKNRRRQQPTRRQLRRMRAIILVFP